MLLNKLSTLAPHPVTLNNRKKDFQVIKTFFYDVIIIGGGITGAGILLDCASRGLNCLLIEKDDFASGTSSRSTKLIHGGLRYLEKLKEIFLVCKFGRERRILLKNAPHLVYPKKMVLPLYTNGKYAGWELSFGLRVYDFLAGVRKNEHRKMYSQDEILQLEPMLNPENLLGGGIYYEYQTSDSRLVIDVIKTALEYNNDQNPHQVKALNYTEVTEFEYEGAKITGVVLKNNLYNDDKDSPEKITVHARCIVNAAGAWVNKVAQLNPSTSASAQAHTPTTHPKALEIVASKGIHIAIPQHLLPLQEAAYIDEIPTNKTHSTIWGLKRKKDKRQIFVIPHIDKQVVYIGTTDDQYNGDFDQIKPNQDEIDYLLNIINTRFKLSPKIENTHIKATWAGIRPLVKNENKEAQKTTEISREDEMIVCPQTGLITIAGGKLSGYRIMAKTVTDKVVEILNSLTEINPPAKTNNPFIALGKKLWGYSKITKPAYEKKCKTTKITLSGGYLNNLADYTQQLQKEYAALNLQKTDFEYLTNKYGSNTPAIISNWQQETEKDPKNRLLFAELKYCLQYEMVANITDFLMRRNPRMYFETDLLTRELVEALNEYLAKFLQLSEQAKQQSLQNTIDALEQNAQFNQQKTQNTVIHKPSFLKRILSFFSSKNKKNPPPPNNHSKSSGSK